MDDQFRRSRRPIDAEEEQEMAATLNDLQTLGATPPPRMEFSRSLKEQLMNASMNASFGTPSVISSLSARPRALPPASRSQHKPLFGWLVSAAMVAALLIGALYFSNRSGEPGNTGSRVPAASFAASPEASGAVDNACDSTDSYFACEQQANLIANSFVFYPNIDATALDVRQVQLQGWALEPGTIVSGVDAADSTAKGAVVDFVISGAYEATFDAPVVVFRSAITIRPNIEYHDAGDVIELGSGDAVSYQLGKLVELRNPLGTLRVEFKRAVIYEGDITAFSAVPAGATTRMEGETTLSDSLVALFPPPGREVSFELWYVRLVPGEPFPPTRWTDATSIGPVDHQNGSEGSEGFVLVIRGVQG